LNPDDGTLEFPPTLREKALELMKKIEDVKAGRLKVDREIDELTMALRNPEHPGRCRGYGGGAVEVCLQRKPRYL
jgi:hypothetical protein